jgi:hypothetical protein
MNGNESRDQFAKTRDILLYIGIVIVIIGSIYFAFNYIEQRT